MYTFIYTCVGGRRGGDPGVRGLGGAAAGLAPARGRRAAAADPGTRAAGAVQEPGAGHAWGTDKLNKATRL